MHYRFLPLLGRRRGPCRVGLWQCFVLRDPVVGRPEPSPPGSAGSCRHLQRRLPCQCGSMCVRPSPICGCCRPRVELAAARGGHRGHLPLWQDLAGALECRAQPGPPWYSGALPLAARGSRARRARISLSLPPHCATLVALQHGRAERTEHYATRPALGDGFAIVGVFCRVSMCFLQVRLRKICLRSFQRADAAHWRDAVGTRAHFCFIMVSIRDVSGPCRSRTARARTAPKPHASGAREAPDRHVSGA